MLTLVRVLIVLWLLLAAVQFAERLLWSVASAFWWISP